MMRYKKLVFRTALFSVLGSCTMAFATVQPQNGAESAYLEYVSAWKMKNISLLNSIIANDYLTLNGDKHVAHKINELAEAKASPVYDVMQVDEIHSVVLKNVAVISALLTVAGTSNGKGYKVQVRDLATFVRRDGRWQLLADQSAS